MRFLKWFLILVFSLTVISFAVYNRQKITIGFPGIGDFIEIPLFLLLFLMLFCGLGIAYSIMLISKMKLKSRMRGDKKRIEALEHEISILKTEKKVGEILLPPAV